MGIIAMLIMQRSYRKKVTDWPKKTSCALDIALDPPFVNDLKFGSHIEEARTFGRPDTTLISSDSSVIVRLDFTHLGLTLEYEDDRLVYIGILVDPKADISSASDMKPARATLLYGSRVALSPKITAEGIVEILGPPVDDDQDDDERILTHDIDKYTIESEFTLNNSLKRFNLFPA